MELYKISSSLDHTLKNTDLQSVASGLSEVLLDSLLENGIIKDIPIVGTIVGSAKTIVGIRETLFLKKVLSFIIELKDVPASERKEMIDQIDKSKKYRVKVGEKLLYIIDRCADHEKSEIAGRLFLAFLKDIISYDDFLRTVNAVEKVLPSDIHYFVEHDFDGYWAVDAEQYINSGLVSLDLYFEDDYKAVPVNSPELKVQLSDIGMKLKKALIGAI
ncbi:MAG: hypothetical protein MI802_10535 [Desulfobacterales bacterium]|nr:hypothetical protein [Desulfobacterales bacterium]